MAGGEGAHRADVVEGDDRSLRPELEELLDPFGVVRGTTRRPGWAASAARTNAGSTVLVGCQTSPSSSARRIDRAPAPPIQISGCAGGSGAKVASANRQ